ncbi:Ig heavy chain C region isoform X1 [Xenopus laevis]|uniref:Ig heavy chain C region isoform X1 n=1 Tax=Xenopus laevis TaxID=8355 RepID=A0A8J1LYY7_XENLA|nr:Ig heavy chain C region isoform X1 [Xenopus laevis]
MPRLGFLYLFLLHQTGAVLNIFPSSQRALAGSDVLLPCSFQVDKTSPNPEPPTVTWYFQDKEIVRYDNKGLSLNPRTSFNGQAANLGDASLSLANVSISDEGIYRCRVIYRQQKDTRVILDVLVPPVLLIPNKVIQRKKETTLICMANGFYPEDIDISWYKDNKHLTNSELGKQERNPDGTYRVKGTVTLPPMDGKMDHNFSCRVQHLSLQQPLQEDFQLEYEDGSSSALPVACGIAVLLAVLVIVAIIWKRRKKATFSLKPIAGPTTLIVGEETKLQCTGTNCASDVQVTWSVKGGGSDEWIVINQLGDEEATEPLLIGQYVVHCEKEGNNHIATLTFTLHLDTHKGATFSCKFVSGGKTKEKHFHTKTIQAKPKVQEPINITFQGSQNLDLTLNLQRFYPKDIKIKWDCGEETQQPSKENWRENSDLTWDVTSVCSVPKGLFKDKAFRVRVTWEHESMGDPESREVSAADIPFRCTLL